MVMVCLKIWHTPVLETDLYKSGYGTSSTHVDSEIEALEKIRSYIS